ncbi:hypothetical protein GY21_01800 [Cryobacterium roopkundense]|uniref:PNPLA domain-containing protein n=1 Tax=Cryobacterium roopkundense TaxID=1001240 RepID=A0A099JRW2_9MICO|nr:DUF3376 domain-containing protein [Cryobacterium roopkundense]KGJ81124.1 hypothetical protein GY21_01800 [Cryobacterium roopkundense]MBB5641882.1 hypothetical protein [Cryobacterium roopkundense]
MTEPAGFAVRLRLHQDEPAPDLVPLFFDDARPRPFGRTLRLALAMKGGVSLAVWIGGTVAELDILRRLRLVADVEGVAAYMLVADPHSATPDHVLNENVVSRASVYARMLADRGFDRVEFDVLAGASAGGLNSVIYAAAQRTGAAPDEMLHTWANAGAIWRFLQKPGLSPVNAPLRGDEYFAPAVNTAIAAYYDLGFAAGNELHRADRIVVDLSATILDREDGPDRGTREGRGHFHFVGAAHPCDPEQDPTAEQAAQAREYRRGIPAARSLGRVESLARLAYAARSTSSVPGGFEPALISSVASDATAPADDRIDMTFAFHAHRTADDVPYRVIDGGLTDNIPIDRAFRAIRAMPSDVHSRRALMYLNPEGPASVRPHVPEPYSGDYPPRDLATDPPLTPRSDRLSLVLGVAVGALAISFGRESGDEEGQNVDDFRRELLLAQGRDQGLSVLVDDLSEVAVVDALRAYVRFRSSTDLDLLTRVLLDPAVWQLGTDLPTRSVVTALERRRLTSLESELHDLYGASAENATESELRRSEVCAGPEALCAASLNILSWIQTLERSQFEQTGSTDIDLDCEPYATLGDVRLAVYAVLGAADRLRDEILAGVVAVANALPIGTPADVLARAVSTRWLRPESPLPHWTTLDAVVTLLRHVPAVNTLIPASSEWEQSPWRGISARPGLDSLDTSAFTAARGVRESLLTLDFWEVSADEVPAHYGEFASLMRGQLRRGLRSALSLPQSQLQAPVIDALLSQTELRAASKLNGARYLNLSGFLSAEWRLNDWWWGRLDAGAGVVRFLGSLPVDAPLTRAKDPGSDPVLLVQDQILLQAAAQKAEWAPLGRNTAPTAARTDADGEPRVAPNIAPDEVRAALRRGADSLRNLEPGYRAAVGSQALRVAFRSLGRWGTPWWMHLILVVARPIAVLVPLVLDPPRALLVAAVLGGGLTLSSAAEGRDAPGWWTLLILLTTACVLLALLRFVHASRQWRAIGDIVAELDGGEGVRQTEVRTQYRRAVMWWCVLMAGGTVFVTVAVGVSDAGGMAAATMLVLSGAGAFLLAAYRIRTVPANSGYRGRDAVVSAFAVVLLLIVPLCSRALGGGITAVVSGSETVVLLAATAGLISLITNWGWQAGWHPAQPRLVPTTLVAVLSWLAQGLLAGWAAGLVCAGLLSREGWADSFSLSTVAVVTSLFVSGTVQWWLPDLLAWLPTYEPKDLTRRGIE